MVESSVVGVYKTLSEAEAAVRSLGDGGFPIQKVSIIAQHLEDDRRIHGYVTACDVARSSATTGAWVGGIFGLLVGAAFLWVPGVGPLVVAGSLASMLLGGIEGAVAGCRDRCARLAARPRHFQGEDPQVRGSHQGRKVPRHRSRPSERGREGTRDPGDYQAGTTRPAHPGDNRLTPRAAVKDATKSHRSEARKDGSCAGRRDEVKYLNRFRVQPGSKVKAQGYRSGVQGPPREPQGSGRGD